MNEMPVAPIPESNPSPLQIWGKALTKPSEQTFEEIASSPNAKASTAYLWIFIASLIQMFLVAIIQSSLIGSYASQYGFGDTFGNRGLGSVLIGAICGAPILAALTTLFFAIGVFVVQWIARMFGGTGTTDRLAYSLASIVAPFSIITGILTLFSAIPFVGLCISGLLTIAGIYVLVLEAMAVKAVNRFSWGAAFGSLLIPGLIIGLLCACLVGGLFVLIAPAIRNAVPTFTP